MTNKADTNIYLYKRFRRIIPIYLLALLFSLTIGLFLNIVYRPSYNLLNLIGNLLFLQTSASATPYWFSPYGENGPLWSLSFEMFFYLFLPIFSYLILKYRLSARIKVWSLLIVLTLASIAINRYLLFIPWLSFLSLFCVWWLGYEIAIDQFEKNYNICWIYILSLGLLILIFKTFVPSSTLIELAQGMLMAVALNFLFLLNRNWHSSLKKGLKRIFNFGFEQIGHGSYALYALHYPLFIYMDARTISPSFQIFYTFVLLVCCIIIEKWAVKQKFIFFMRDYLAIKQPNIG